MRDIEEISTIVSNRKRLLKWFITEIDNLLAPIIGINLNTNNTWSFSELLENFIKEYGLYVTINGYIYDELNTNNAIFIIDLNLDDTNIITSANAKIINNGNDFQYMSINQHIEAVEFDHTKNVLSSMIKQTNLLRVNYSEAYNKENDEVSNFINRFGINAYEKFLDDFNNGKY